MRAAELETRQIVVERGRDLRVLPIRFVVAIGAGGSETTFVLIFVARGARRRDAEKRRGASCVGLVMAFAARRIFVRAVERPARFGVIERGLVAAGPANEAIVHAMMLDMAALAGLPLVRATVKALPRVDACAEVVVASEAISGLDAFSGRVALGAILIAFERGVPPAQRPGREQLRRRASDDEKQRERREDAKESPHEKIHR
jgi:hypothetical protein